MAKDPAFLFYPGDYLGGTMGFSLEMHGGYVLALVFQHQSGPFSEQQILMVIGNVWDKIRHKFKEKNGLFFNQRLQQEIDKRRSHSEHQKSNIMRRWHKNQCVSGNTTVLPLENENENENENEIRNENVIEIENENENGIGTGIGFDHEGMQGEKKKRAIKPTIDQVREYCAERKNFVDPQRFFDYYESNGWRVGKNPMKDFRAAVRTWERNENGRRNGGGAGFGPAGNAIGPRGIRTTNTVEQREIDAGLLTLEGVRCA